METTLQIITIILALIGLIAPPIGLYLRKRGKQEAADIVDSLGGAVDKIKPLISAETAKRLTDDIKRRADEKGVLGALDDMLKRAGHNVKTRSELATDQG